MMVGLTHNERCRFTTCMLRNTGVQQE